MTAKQLIDTACAYAGIPKSELAEKLGWSKQTLSNRIKTGKFTIEEWAAIGKALGAKIRISVEFPDGTRI